MLGYILYISALRFIYSLCFPIVSFDSLKQKPQGKRLLFEHHGNKCRVQYLL